MYQSYQFGVLSCHAIGVLDQSLKLVVLGESDDLQHCAELGENLRRKGNDLSGLCTLRHRSCPVHLELLTYLVQNVQGDGVEEVLHDHPEDGALGRGSSDAGGFSGNGHAGHAASMQSVDGLQGGLGTLRGEDKTKSQACGS